MIVKSPSRHRVEALRTRFADVVQKGRPTQPQIIRMPANIIEHFKRVVEIVFMRTSVYLFHPLHSCQLGKNERQQAAPSQLHEAFRRRGRHHYLIQFVGNTLAGDDLYPFPVPFQCLERLFIYIKIQLGGKTHAAHHAQRVVAESNVGVERRTDEAVFHVPHAVERVDQFSETFTVQTYGQCINREITAVLVVFQRPVFHHRLTRVMAVTLLPGSYELHLHSLELDLCRTEIAEHTQVCASPQPAGQSLGQCYAAPHRHDIDVLRRALQKKITHITAYDIAFHTLLISHFRYLMENLFVQQMYQIFPRQIPHSSKIP